MRETWITASERKEDAKKSKDLFDECLDRADMIINNTFTKTCPDEHDRATMKIQIAKTLMEFIIEKRRKETKDVHELRMILIDIRSGIRQLVMKT